MERIGIIGDVHAEHQRLETALHLLEKKIVDLLLCTGDLADGRGDLDACCRMLTDAGALVVAGNRRSLVLGGESKACSRRSLSACFLEDSAIHRESAAYSSRRQRTR